jgi:hypothetical protein
MRELGFRFLHGVEAFAQFTPGVAGMAPVDLMFVDAATWEIMEPEARIVTFLGIPIRIPRVEHMIALKLHAASSATRDPQAQDWEDIRQIVRAWHLDPADPYFSQLILRYGGEEARRRILTFLE